VNRPPATERLTPLIRPRSVAILGASARRRTAGNDVIANLRGQEFSGPIIAVHRDARSIDGVPAVPSVAHLPDDLDAAVVSLPAHAVVPALRMLARHGCRSAMVPSVGMSGADQRELASLTAAAPLQLLGPNCLGLVNYTDRVPLWIAEAIVSGEPPGHTALVAQSGSACIFTVRAAPTVGFSKVISSGNELGVTTGDYLSWLAADPATSSVGVVIESLRDLAAFVVGVDALRRAGKPIVALKVGRSRQGMAATVAHTGALVGDGQAYDALFADLDIPTVGDYDEMASVLECFQDAATRSSSGPRVAMVTISGGQAAMGADLAERCGTPLADLAPETVGRLRELAPDADVNNPYDIGASLVITRESYAEALRVLADDPGVDVIIPVLDGADTLSEVEVSYAKRYFEGAADAAEGKRPVPVIVASSSSLGIHKLCREWLGDVPILRGMHNALIAAQALPRNLTAVSRGARSPVAPPDREALRDAVVDAGGSVSHDLGRRLLEAYGVPVVRSVVAPDAEAAVAAADALGYPVVIKVTSADIAHRSEIGGVVTGIADAIGVRAAVHGIATRVGEAQPAAEIGGFEVQPHVAGALEAMMGFVTDPVFGATVSVGSGGTLVELIADLAVAGVPMTRTAARRTIARTMLARIAGGYRNLVAVTDLAPLARALEALSHLAADFSDLFAEVDLNPVLVQPGSGRVVVVDALFVARSADGDAGRSPRAEIVW
jgi:acyl-CoA synthetase (NDP forming)